MPFAALVTAVTIKCDITLFEVAKLGGAAGFGLIAIALFRRACLLWALRGFTREWRGVISSRHVAIIPLVTLY